MAGTTHRFEPRRPDKMLLNIKYNDMDVDHDVARRFLSKNRGKNPARDRANKFVARRGGKVISIMKQ